MRKTFFFPVRSTVLLGTALLLLTNATQAGGPTVYSLNGDWSYTANPNGPWSYNYNDSPISVPQTFFWGQSGWGIYDFADGSILKGSAPAGTIDPWGSLVPPAHDWQPNDVVLHALSIPYGGEFTFVNVRWTSPADGTIDILGRAWDAQIFDDREVSWGLSVGGDVFAQRSGVRGLYRTDADAQFGANLVNGHTLTSIPVTLGEVVEFQVATQTFYGHFVGLDENISFVPVPEPTTASLVILGSCALLLWRRNRRSGINAAPQ